MRRGLRGSGRVHAAVHAAEAPAAPVSDSPEVEEARRAVAASPRDPSAHDALGEVLLETGALDRAERAFQGALAISRDFAKDHHGVAIVHFHRGDTARGMASLEAGLALVPAIDQTYGRTRLLESIAWAHALEGRTREALEASDASVAAQGLDAAIAAKVTHIGRARILLHAGRMSDALAELAAARQAGAPAFVVRASSVVAVLVHARAGDTCAASAALAELAADPGAAEHPGLVEAKVAVALANGELDATATLVATLDELDPYAAEQASFALARALQRAGRGADARARLAKLASRYLRSVQSAYVRRAAAAAG